MVQARRRALGNIQFIGNLYQHRMLTEKIMHGCITELMREVCILLCDRLPGQGSRQRACAFQALKVVNETRVP